VPVIVIHLYPKHSALKQNGNLKAIILSAAVSVVGTLLTPDADVAGAESKQWISVQAVISTSRYFAKQQGSI
jgi:hypothetical protein